MIEEKGYYKLSDKDIRAAIKMYIEREAGVTLDASVATATSAANVKRCGS